MERREILWRCEALSSAEHGVLERVEDGWLMSGVVVLPIGGVPGHIEYVVTTDDQWVTRRTTVTVSGTPAATYELEAVGGCWRVNGAARRDLDGCVDVDLGWTPATNTLPIRRLQLAVGDTTTTTVAWFRFPEMVIERTMQQYTRTGEHSWRYVAGPYDFQLEVDDVGRVIEYGDDLWRAAAAS